MKEDYRHDPEEFIASLREFTLKKAEAVELHTAAPCGANDIQVNMLSMRHALYHWYKIRHAADPAERLTRIGDFGSRVVGTTPDSAVKTKGAETWGLLLFLVDRWAGRDLASGDAALLTGAGALVRMMMIWKRSGRSLQTSDVQASFDYFNELFAATLDFDDLDLTKKHMRITHPNGCSLSKKRCGNERKVPILIDIGLVWELCYGSIQVEDSIMEQFMLFFNRLVRRLFVHFARLPVFMLGPVL